MGKFFEPFIFEQLPTIDQRADSIYLREVELSDIYLGILGKEYGKEDKKGLSPTEREFDHATLHNKTRLLFLTRHTEAERDKKQNKFIIKAQEVLIRKKFENIDGLKSAVYASLVRYLEEKEIIRTVPFDTNIDTKAKLEALDGEKIKNFVRIARSKRGFPLAEETEAEIILNHLNLLNEKRITNAGILLFGKEPQRYFINSEVRCAHFHGTEVTKPIPSYKVYKGDVFELVDQTVDFVLSKLDYILGTRKETISVPGTYEIPKEIVAEAIVNAVVHRDYTNNGSVQVMLFRDRLELWNPGSLPLGWTTEKLKRIHSSVPANPLLAEPMYLKGYIERLGTGTSDIIRIARENGLKEPDFMQEEIFKTIIYRPLPVSGQAGGEVTGQATGQATGQVDEFIRRIILILDREMKRTEIMETLELSHRENFIKNYLDPAISSGYIELTYPDSPNHPNQKYRLTKKGKAIKKKL